MKLKYYTLLLLTGFSLLAAPGDFVKDIKIEELDFKIPEVKKIDLNQNLKYSTQERQIRGIEESKFHN